MRINSVLWILLSSLAFSGCTLAITMVHTEGTANDIVDSAQSPQNDIKPDISVSGLPG